jgi:hypothetical protein
LSKLQAHTNAFLERKKLLRKKKESKDMRECRELYCTSFQWITDFGRLLEGGGRINNSTFDYGNNSNKIQISTVISSGEEDEFIVPADEHFTRCPVSREMFETIWDEEEGEFMYRNAAKVILTESADSSLYKLGQPTSSEDSSVRYLIVHKLLVLNSWLQQGKAASLGDVIARYEAARSAKGEVMSRQLRAAAGDEENDDDVFVIIELIS